MWQRLLPVAGAVFGFLLLVSSILTIRYRVTARFLKITWLWVIPVRLIRLSNIRYLTPKRVFWAERWYGTFNVRARWLVVVKRHGLFKYVVITPRNPFVFKAEIERAQAELLKESGPGSVAP